MKSWLVERVHGYYFIATFFIGIILGVLACLVTNEKYYASPVILIIAAGFVAASCIRFRKIFLLFMLMGGILLGLWRGSSVEYNAEGYNRYYGQTVELSGVVVDDISYNAAGDQRFKLKNITIEETGLDGEVWVSSSEKVAIQRSDIVAAKGYLGEGFGGFSATLVRTDVISVQKTSTLDIGLQVRDSFANATVDIVPEPERSLGLGYLLGLKSALPESLEQQIQILGLTHVVVASGYNLTILVSFARRLFVKVSKYLSAVTGGLMIAGFTLITGFSPSMSRAGLVAGLTLLAWYYGRKIHPLMVLAVAAAVTLLIRPSYIWGDLGWYLSFTAFFGVLVLAPLIHHYFWGANKKPSFLRELIVATFSAQLMTLPIILYSFGAFSAYSLPANILILPVIPFCMLATFIAGLGGLFLPFITDLLALPAVWLLKYCTFVIEKMSGLPHSQGEFTINPLQVVIGYAFIVIITTVLLIKTKHNFLKDKTIVD